MRQLQKKAGRDLFIFPVSVNELMIASDNGEDIGWLKELIKRENSNDTPKDLRLSDSLYYYRREKGVFIKS